MSKITAIRPGRGREKRVKVLLDSEPAFSLDAEVAALEVLTVGQELSESRIETLIESDRLYRCLGAASHLLSYRPRSEAELKQRLLRRGFDENTVQTALTKLKDQGQVDDQSFAEFWRDNRETFSPRSQWLTKLELKRKGVATDIIEQVVEPVDNSDSAYRAALSKITHHPIPDYETFRQRLGGYLKRRGFNYEVINSTLERLWREQTSQT